MAELGTECRQEVCDASCVPVLGTLRLRGIGSTLVRAALVTAALLLGGATILLITLRPGPGRTRRGSWAMTRASRLLLTAMGIRLHQHGGPRSGASLIVANHVSWLDVLVLAAGGSLLPVAKADVASWPVIGVLARRSGALFINRDRLSELPVQVDRIADLLRRGHRVQVFPEATTRCGSSLSPFRRAAFQAAIDAAVVISPVALTYRDPKGNPVPATAFVGDISLLASVLRVLRAGPVIAHATWLPAFAAIVATGTAATDRARVAAAAERSIARHLKQPMVSGHHPIPADKGFADEGRRRTADLRHGADLQQPVLPSRAA